jgi:hypothetical protein
LDRLPNASYDLLIALSWFCDDSLTAIDRKRFNLPRHRSFAPLVGGVSGRN